MKKVLSRVASPAGFAIVLLLFFVLPFVSVSCEVPGAGSLGVNYSGTNLVTGSDPEAEVSPELTEAFEQLGGTAPGTGSESSEDEAPEAGVQVLAILAALVILFGVGTFLIPRLKARLLGAAAAAGVGLVLTVVTLLVATSNLESALIDQARETDAGMPEIEAAVGDIIGSEIGFWLVVVGLALLLLGNLGAALLGGRRPTLRFAGAAGATATPGEQPAGAPPGTTVDPLTGQAMPSQPADPPPASSGFAHGAGEAGDEQGGQRPRDQL